MRIELPVFAGAHLASWHRSYASLTMWQLAARTKRHFTRPLFQWYRKGLALAFRIRNVATRDAPLRVEAYGTAFHLAPEGEIAFHFWSGLRFERAELQFILRILRPGMTLFDIGANSGLYSIAAAKQAPVGSYKIFAFEPCPTTFAVLKKNISLNGLTDVHAFPLAISDQPGEASLYVNTAWKDGLNSLKDPRYEEAEVIDRVQVRTETLNAFAAEKGISRVDVMKVDVEGAELLVFRGAQELLARDDAPLILYEGYSWCTAAFHYHPVELMWLLEEFGYELFVLDGSTGQPRQRKPGETYDAMMVAVKPSHASYAEVAARGVGA